MLSLFEDLPPEVLSNGNVQCDKCKAQYKPGEQCWRCTPIIITAAEPALARTTDPETSQHAANQVDTTKLENLITLLLQGAGPSGLTTKEMAAKSKLPRDSISPRMKSLIKKGLVLRDTEKREGCFVFKFVAGEFS